MEKPSRLVPTCSHWGNYLIESDGPAILGVHNYAVDTEPTTIGQSLQGALDPDTRIPQPMVRSSYLENPGYNDTSGRGCEPFVPVSWDVALDLAADALSRAMKQHGPRSQEDFQARQGRPLFASPPKEVSVEQIQQFCRSVNQMDWFHFDEERCAASPFGAIVGSNLLELTSPQDRVQLKS